MLAKPRKVLSALFVLCALALGPSGLSAQEAEQPRQAPSEVPLPKRTKFVSPSYPPEAMAQGLRGIVILELVIDVQGKVASVDVMRSVPPFDEAATSAVRQWEYEITRVDGKPVPVRLTLPITFAIKLPEITREAGIPELVRGVAPMLPSGAGNRGATVKAELTLNVDGSVAEARVTSGESPWAESMIQAVRTWRFAPTTGEGQLSFEAQAEFGPAGKDAARVVLNLRAPRRIAAASPEPSAAPPAESPAPASPEPVASPSTASSPPPAPETPAATAAAVSPAAPSPSPTPAPTTQAQGPPPAPVPPAATAPAAAEPSPSPAPATAAPSTSAPPANAPPPVEIIPAAPAGQAASGQGPAPAPPAEGVSAVRDVTLGMGVPDLASGRRPMVPPFARMSGTSGEVVVRFAVDAAGLTSGFQVEGPEMLREAARQTVASWTFRRDRADRVYLRGTLSYDGDVARARVERAE